MNLKNFIIQKFFKRFCFFKNIFEKSDNIIKNISLSQQFIVDKSIKEVSDNVIYQKKIIKNLNKEIEINNYVLLYTFFYLKKIFNENILNNANNKLFFAMLTLTYGKIFDFDEKFILNIQIYKLLDKNKQIINEFNKIDFNKNCIFLIKFAENYIFKKYRIKLNLIELSKMHFSNQYDIVNDNVIMNNNIDTLQFKMFQYSINLTQTLALNTLSLLPLVQLSIMRDIIKSNNILFTKEEIFKLSLIAYIILSKNNFSLITIKLSDDVIKEYIIKYNLKISDKTEQFFLDYFNVNGYFLDPEQIFLTYFDLKE